MPRPTPRSWHPKSTKSDLALLCGTKHHARVDGTERKRAQRAEPSSLLCAHLLTCLPVTGSVSVSIAPTHPPTLFGGVVWGVMGGGKRSWGVGGGGGLGGEAGACVRWRSLLSFPRACVKEEREGRGWTVASSHDCPMPCLVGECKCECVRANHAWPWMLFCAMGGGSSETLSFWLNSKKVP